MKYLKEYNNTEKLYKEITTNKLCDYLNKYGANITSDNFNTIRDYLSEIAPIKIIDNDYIFSDNSDKKIRCMNFYIGTSIIQFIQLSDEYFLLGIFPRKYFVCDTIKGVIDCLKDTMKNY